MAQRIAKFFSNEVTHFITNRPTPETEGDKENSSKSKASGSLLLRSPIKLRGLCVILIISFVHCSNDLRSPVDDLSASGYETLVKKAKQFGMKIWDTTKLDSVLERCYVPAQSVGAPSHGPSRSLTSLLESERKYGTTSERDPTQKRHDYHYFSKGSYFVLVEDIRQEIATIAALEYPVTRTSDGKEKGTWPIPHCHPLARGPFIEYNEKEERRREKQERYDREREEIKAAEMKKLKLKQVQRKQHDLRRSVSMSNLQREAQMNCAPNDSTNGMNASGHLGSYIAASGNSVGITSTYGTTSTVGAGSSMRNSLTQLPPQLRDRLQNQVITTRRVIGTDKDKGSGVSKASASSTMMPPPDVPERKHLLRKSKSTNTLRLPKRDEKSKPGYCESCRQKFENFSTVSSFSFSRYDKEGTKSSHQQHIRGRKHQKFANNDANFAQLDAVLSRVRRPTIAEVQKAEQDYEACRQRALQSTLHFGSSSSQNKNAGAEEAIADEPQYIYLDDDDDDMGEK